MAKFGKFLLTTAALTGTAAAAYYIYKNRNSAINVTNEEETPDEDYDDFSDLEKESETPHYVPLTKERVNDMVEKVAGAAQNVAEKATDMAKNIVEKVSGTAEDMAQKAEDAVETVEEKVETAVEAAEEKVEETVDATADSFATLPEQMAVEESVEEFFNDEEEN